MHISNERHFYKEYMARLINDEDHCEDGYGYGTRNSVTNDQSTDSANHCGTS